jgi:hypothetical protein
MSNAERASRRRRPILVAAVALAGAAIMVIGLATSRSVAAGPEAERSTQPTGYLPSISDLMIATIPTAARAALGSPGRMEIGNLQPTNLEISTAHSIASGSLIRPNTTSPFQT